LHFTRPNFLFKRNVKRNRIDSFDEYNSNYY